VGTEQFEGAGSGVRVCFRRGWPGGKERATWCTDRHDARERHYINGNEA
jgi:hypothetical protein